MSKFVHFVINICQLCNWIMCDFLSVEYLSQRISEYQSQIDTKHNSFVSYIFMIITLSNNAEIYYIYILLLYTDYLELQE